MARFRYIITSVIDGDMKGIDDEDSAFQYAQSEDFFVYDSKDAVWIDSELARQELREAAVLEDEDETEIEDEDEDESDEDEEDSAA
jgi:hypothetical protein